MHSSVRSMVLATLMLGACAPAEEADVALASGAESEGARTTSTHSGDALAAYGVASVSQQRSGAAVDATAYRADGGELARVRFVAGGGADTIRVSFRGQASEIRVTGDDVVLTTGPVDLHGKLLDGHGVRWADGTERDVASATEVLLLAGHVAEQIGLGDVTSGAAPNEEPEAE